jgi:hypothetical protein
MQQPPPYYIPPYANAPPPAAPHDSKATMALVFGVLSLVGAMCYLGWIFGIVAIVLGITSRKDITRAQGALGGAGTALAGIITGSIGLGISLLYLAFVIGMWIYTFNAASKAPTVPPMPPTPYTATATPIPAPPPAPTASSLASMSNVTDLSAGDGSLKSQLAKEYRRAVTAKKKLLVVTMATWSKECEEIARAWSDARLQIALYDVEVVRVDVDDFKSDLISLRMDRTDVPWFFLIGPTLAPSDAINADEWGANNATNITPVMSKFAHGTLNVRKTPKQGAPL